MTTSSRSKRKGIGCAGKCDLDKTPLLVRGDVVSVVLEDGRTVEFPETWGLVHDPTGQCVDKCEVLVCPYTITHKRCVGLPPSIYDAALNYWGEGYELKAGTVVLPTGPWERVGRIVRVYYDRYGELASPYQHPFKDIEDTAVLYRQQRPQRYGRRSHRSYRISLPDGCVINAHGFVWP